jgi:phosphate:Na+ symporter
MSVLQIINLLCGAALFLFGMSRMGDGLQSVSGSKLEPILFKLSGTPLRGVLLGTGVTAVIQSSSATSVMAVGFVNAGMMRVRQAVSVILGAILGTSITGWVISLSYIEGSSGVLSLLSTATLTGLVAVVGIILRIFSKKQVHHHIGDILMGFAILMFGMSTMSGSVSGLGKQAWFTDILTSLSNPFLGILVGAVFTAVLQSASAAVGIVQALSVTGAMSFSAALPLLMGVAIGASVPVLLSALGANTDGKRTAMVYLVAEFVSVLICASLFYLANVLFNFKFMGQIMDPFSIAFVNTMLRIAMVLILMPMIDILETIVSILIPEKEDPSKQLTIRLEERFLPHPALAIEQSRLTINDMAECAKNSFFRALDLLVKFDAAGFAEVEKLEADADRYEDGLGSYLVKLTGQEMTQKQNDDVSKYLHTLSDFERISDHALNVAAAAREIHEKNLVFSGDAALELDVLEAAVKEILSLAISSFISGDMDTAARVEPLEEVIDGMCDEMKLHHVERLKKGECTLSLGFVFTDLLTNYERVADHCSNVAVALIELRSDSFDTHEYLRSIKKMRDASFTHLYEEYQKEYSL